MRDYIKNSEGPFDSSCFKEYVHATSVFLAFSLPEIMPGNIFQCLMIGQSTVMYFQSEWIEPRWEKNERRPTGNIQRRVYVTLQMFVNVFAAYFNENFVMKSTMVRLSTPQEINH